MVPAIVSVGRVGAAPVIPKSLLERARAIWVRAEAYFSLRRLNLNLGDLRPECVGDVRSPFLVDMIKSLVMFRRSELEKSTAPHVIIVQVKIHLQDKNE